MKFAQIVVATMILSGCSEEGAVRSPVAPATPALAPSTSVSVSGMVLGESGACLDDATVQVVHGQRAGQSIAQTTPCGYWDYEGGFTFQDLTPNVEMTLRASAPGFVAQDMTVRPTVGGRQNRVFFTLSEILTR